MTHSSFPKKRAPLSAGRQAAILVVITAIGILLRLYKLGEWSLWIDEIFTISRVQAHGSLQSVFQQWWRPTVSLILTRGAFNLLGVDEFSARLAPALVGAITIPVLFFPIRRIFGAAVALVAMAFLAISPWHLEWSQTARFYTAMLLFYSLAGFVFFLAFEEDRPLYILLYYALLYLAIVERAFAIFLIPVTLVYLGCLRFLPFQKPKGFNQRNLWITISPLLGFGLWELYRYLTSGSTYLLSALDLSFTRPIEDPFRLASFIVFNIGVPLVTLALIAGFAFSTWRERKGLYFFLNATIPILLLLAMNPFIFTKDRYVFGVLTSFVILGAAALAAAHQRTAGRGRVLVLAIGAMLVFDMASADFLYYRINHGNRLDWGRAYGIVAERAAPEDVVVTGWTQLGSHYLDLDMLPWKEVDAQAVIELGSRVWFVLDSETIWSNSPLKEWVERNAELIEVLYLRREDDNYLRIYTHPPSALEPQAIQAPLAGGSAP